jgi:hypothetical protein
VRSGDGAGVERGTAAALGAAVPHRGARTEIESHDVDLDISHRFFSDYEPTCELAPSDEAVTDMAAAQEQYAKDAAQVGHMAERAGMKKVSDTLYVLDLGNGVCPVGEEKARWVGS